MIKPITLSALVFLIAFPSVAQIAHHDPPNITEGTTQWSNLDMSMADLIGKGYSLVSVTTFSLDPSAAFNIRFVYFLSKGSHLVRCSDGFDPGGGWAVLKCQGLVQAHPVDKNSN